MKSACFSLLTIIFCSGCFDWFEPKKNIPGDYYLAPTQGTEWGLYFDLGNAGHGRMDSVGKIGWTDKYIFAESNSNYYFLDKTKDEGLLNANEIVVGPFGRREFEEMLDSLKIEDFEFEIEFD